jgi:hypothetical protein
MTNRLFGCGNFISAIAKVDFWNKAFQRHRFYLQNPEAKNTFNVAMLTHHRNITNWSLTHALWFACVIGGDLWSLVAGALYWLIYVIYIGDLKTEWRSILIIAGTGFGIDILLSTAGLITFNSTLAIPLWMLVLWSAFATLFHHGLEWLITKPVLALALGIISGPLAYFAGATLSMSNIHVSSPVFIAIYAILWCLYMPLFLKISHRLGTSHS